MIRHILLLFLLFPNAVVQSLSSSSSADSAAAAARQKLSTAWSSPSGKLTHSPELVIPEPRDPTAILLLSNAVQTLSERIRGCKTNVAFVQGSVTALQTFCNEQAASMGGFPGPVPVVYCSTSANNNLDEVAEAGADGVLVQVCGGNALQSVSDLTEKYADRQEWIETCQAAVAAGLQPVPEITLAPDAEWTPDDVESAVSHVIESMGMDPVSLVWTINAPVSDDDDDDDDNNNKPDDEAQQQASSSSPVPIPTVPSELGRKIPFLGSVRVTAGDNRLSAESQRFKDAGFAGTFLRSDCVPGFRLQPDLEIVGRFWAACVSDLKSTRSKSFGFRAKNNMEKNAMTQWSNYQQNVIESGALGDPAESYSIVDEAAGEYKGFA